MAEVHPELSEAQQALVDTVKLLATDEGGDTPDILKSGTYNIFIGNQLVAYILNIDYPENPPQLFYLLDVQIGEYTESVGVDSETGRTAWEVNGHYPTYDKDTAPDYAIQSFMNRFQVTGLVEIVVNPPNSSFHEEPTGPPVLRVVR